EALLLRQVRPSLELPILRDARWSARRGISLPAYMSEDARDVDVAVHVARYADADAALVLAGPGEKRTIEALRGSRDYPLEWTHRVAVAMFVAECKLVQNQVDGATELVLLHQQLREVLDSKTRSGPLGALLLPLGRRALEEAAAAWRSGGARRKVLAG